MLRVARRTLRRWESPRLPGPQSRSAQQPASTGPPGTGGPPSLPRHPFRVTPTPLSHVGCWRVSTPERPAQVRACPMPLPHSPRSPAVADAQSPSLGRPGASRAAATAPALEAVAPRRAVCRPPGPGSARCWPPPAGGCRPMHSAWRPSPPATRAPARPWTCPACGRYPPTRPRPAATRSSAPGTARGEHGRTT